MKSNLPAFLLNKDHGPLGETNGRMSRRSFLDNGVEGFATLIKTAYVQWDTAHKEGLFQKIDARVKVLFTLFFIIIVSLKRTLMPELAISALVFVIAALSRLNLASFYGRVLFFGLIFGFATALPSSLNVVTGGELLVPLLHLSREHQLWIYHIPQTIGLTRQGLEGVAMLTIRVINSLSLSFLLIYTTPFAGIVRALKSLRVPDPFLMIITLSYKYIFIFARTIEDIHLARKSRTVEINTAEARNWVAGRMAYLLRKTRMRCEEVFSAMLARGFSGDVALYGCGKIPQRDIAAGILLLSAGSFLLFL